MDQMHQHREGIKSSLLEAKVGVKGLLVWVGGSTCWPFVELARMAFSLRRATWTNCRRTSGRPWRRWAAERSTSTTSWVT